jgi:DNA/RNA endonuclease YhcR with UshA esterase domain
MGTPHGSSCEAVNDSGITRVAARQCASERGYGARRRKPTYTPEEAAKHVGETATVTGKVDSFHQSGKGNIFLNMGGAYPNQAFTAFIPSGSSAQFANAQQYDGKTVSVSGRIQWYKGKPEIIVNSPSQISVK